MHIIMEWNGKREELETNATFANKSSIRNPSLEVRNQSKSY